MEVNFVKQADGAQDAGAEGGWITLEVKLDLADLEQLRDDAKRAYEIEHELPVEARTPLASGDEGAYIADFIRQRAASEALEARNVVPAASPKVSSASGIAEASTFTCHVRVYPRPDIGLTSLEPVDLACKRIPKPGFSMKAADSGDESVEYLDDVKALRLAVTERLDAEFPESAMHAISDAYQDEFEADLARRGYDPESYRAMNQLDEEQYAIMLARHALGEARWGYALDAVFAAAGLALAEEDVRDLFEGQHPGFGSQLLELHDLRGDLYLAAQKARRQKALDWLLENAIR